VRILNFFERPIGGGGVHYGLNGQWIQARACELAGARGSVCARMRVRARAKPHTYGQSGSGDADGAFCGNDIRVSVNRHL
jgi:hypothetical protein